MNGLLVLDKPAGMTSRAVVNAVQKWFPHKTKIGHTGTLDPGATGVLVVCVGAATRLADYVQAMGKGYAARFRLGATSTTDDADGGAVPTPNAVVPARDQLEAALAKFVGDIEQLPPAFSALKLDGKRAHDLARKGRDVPLAPRPVRIDAIRLVAYEWPFAEIEIDCGKGTYVRSIARDLGAGLGCGGLVQTLRRTRVGPFTTEQGVGLDATPSDLKLRPLAEAVTGLPQHRVTALDAGMLRNGRFVPLPSANKLPDGTELVLLNPTGELFGIGRVERGFVRPDVIFPLEAAGG